VFLNAQPFKAVTEFGESMKNNWSIDSFEPPVPHAEEMTISELAKAINKETQSLISHLNEHGISADQNSVINNITTESLRSHKGHKEKNNYIFVFFVFTLRLLCKVFRVIC